MNATKAKILFVDDEPSILKGFKLNLGRKYEVFVAESGGEGLRILEEDGPFEVCLLYTSPSPRDQRGTRMPSSA